MELEINYRVPVEDEHLEDKLEEINISDNEETNNKIQMEETNYNISLSSTNSSLEVSPVPERKVEGVSHSREKVCYSKI